MNHQSAHRFILLDKSKVIEIFGWISDPLEQVPSSEGTEIADFEEDLPLLPFKFWKLYSLWTQKIIIRALIFLKHVVLDICHVLFESATLNLNSAWEGIDVEYEAAMIVLIELTIEEVIHTAFFICMISCLFIQIWKDC